MNIPRILSGAALKYIAIGSMLADHVNKAIILRVLSEDSALWLQAISSVFSAVGRFAFPIFFFMLVEGFYNTRNRWRYLRNLILFAIVSELPFDLFMWSDHLLAYCQRQNIYFSLAFALCVIWLVDRVKEKGSSGLALAMLICLAGCLVAWLGRVDYGAKAILIILAFYFFRSNRLLASGMGYLVVFRTVWALPSFAALNLYNGQRGRQNKWLFYWFYPAHLLLLGILRLIFKI